MKESVVLIVNTRTNKNNNLFYSLDAMESDYHQVTSQLDAREILRYLNNLGIHNISGEVLKYFITDLKKLIKYDLENKHEDADTINRDSIPGPERLHSASTFSSRIRSKTYDGPVIKCTRECQHIKHVFNARNSHSAPNLPQKTVEGPLRRACSCARVERKPVNQDSAKDKVSASSNNNLIKVPKQPVKKKCDPVSLYHYYTSLWAKYKSNVPGENDWADLRWSVRQKMAGSIPKGSDTQGHNKENKGSKNKL